MCHSSLAVYSYITLRSFGLAFLSIALISLPLSPAYSDNRSVENSEDVIQIKKEFNRMKSEAALFNAYMAQVERVNATDFGNERAVRAQLERLNKFKPDDVGKGFVSSLIVAATRNPQFRAGVEQKVHEKGVNEFFDALGKDPSLVMQVPGANAAERDVERFSDDARAKIEAVKKKVGAKTRTQKGDSDINSTHFASLDDYLDSAVDVFSALLFIQEAEAAFITLTTLLLILNISMIIISIIGIGIVIIASIQMAYYYISWFAKYHFRYRDCYLDASRQSTYWGREFYKLGCWVAFNS